MKIVVGFLLLCLVALQDTSAAPAPGNQGSFNGNNAGGNSFNGNGNAGKYPCYGCVGGGGGAGGNSGSFNGNNAGHGSFNGNGNGK